ncbi:hypothetical protein [Caballeronia sordidicola]|uniref:hypothetical protein n=1 Tax=Caballeronia sordidicola TaxID=196367 RepID=UPI00094D499C|nr:hypothetical protein [Caballeronia sordidicola]
MNELDLQRKRITLLRAAIDKATDGNVTAFGKRLGYKDGAYIRQMLSGVRPIREKTIFAIEDLPGMRGFFSAQNAKSEVFLVDRDHGLVPIMETSESRKHAAEDAFGVALSGCEASKALSSEAAELVRAVVRAAVSGLSTDNIRAVRQILDTLTSAQKVKTPFNPSIEADEAVAELPSDQDVDDALKSALPGANLEAAGDERTRVRHHKRKSG